KACVLPENPASYRVVRTKSYLFNKADLWGRILIFYQHGMSINRLSIAPGNQTDFPSQAGVVIHRPVPD
ncbi:hypothetical protein ACRE5S_26860, partial [Klebsiella pneumoniae]